MEYNICFSIIPEVNLVIRSLLYTKQHGGAQK